MQYSNLAKRLLITALSAALMACGGSGSGSGSDSTSADSSSTGKLSLGLTDAPVDNLSAVVITVTGVTLKPANGNTNFFEFDTPKTIDLLDLQDGSVESLLEDEEVEAGNYNWVRLQLSEKDGDLYVVQTDNGGEYTLTVPSGFQTGLKLNGGFSVPAGGLANFTIDFDVRKSIVDPQGNGAKADYYLKPSLRLIDNADAGSISGTVDASTIIQTECADSQAYAGLVYVYEGAGETPDDLGGSENPPLVTAPVRDKDKDGTFTYTASFIAAGDYTVSYSCDVDDVEDDESLNFVATQNVTALPSATTTVDFE